jgi:hypothetical protein
MKKFLYTILFALVTIVSVSSCTEEDVKPSLDETSSAVGGRARTGNP